MLVCVANKVVCFLIRCIICGLGKVSEWVVAVAVVEVLYQVAMAKLNRNGKRKINSYHCFANSRDSCVSWKPESYGFVLQSADFRNLSYKNGKDK